MKKILCSLLCLITTTSFADSRHIGTYAEVTVGTAAYYLGVVSSAGSATGAGIDGYGVSGAIGYNFTPLFALEAGDMHFYQHINDGNYVNAPYVSTRFTVPITEQFSFIGKIGVMAPWVPHNGGMALPFTGVGFSYAASQHVDLSLQYQGAVYGVAGVGLLGIGMTYHFD